MCDLPIRVLSLPDSEGRRRKISGMMERLGLAFEFRDAWSPADIPDEMLELLGRQKRKAGMRSGDLLPTELACYASHLGIISDVAEGRLPSPLLVLEDDAILDQRSVEFARRLHDLMRDNPAIEYVNFKNTKGPYVLDKIAVLDDACIFVPWYSSLGMVAYMVCREGARKILRLREKGNRPLDLDMRYAIWEQDLRYWECYPSMIVHDGAQHSTIDPENRRSGRRIDGRTKAGKLVSILKKHGVLNFVRFYPLFIRDKMRRKSRQGPKMCKHDKLRSSSS